MPPAWLTDVFAALMLTVATVSAARLVAARPWHRDAVIIDTDIAHLLMGIAMAGMLASGLTTLPDAVWAGVFAVLTVWFAVRVVRDARANGVRALAGGHCAPHLGHSAAMLYMFLAVTTPNGGSGMAGMGGAASTQSLSHPTLAFAFAFILVGYTAWDLDQLPGYRHSPAVALATTGEPALAGTTASVAGPPAYAGLPGFLLSPGITVGSRIAMGVTMTLMLFLMI
jgi:Domain of unknown function (DUF5134)